MTTANVPATANLPATLDRLRTGLLATHQRIAHSSGASDAQFLKLHKSGLWTYGSEDIEVEQGSQWAIDPHSYMQGYISWEDDDSKPAAKLGEEMVPASAPPVLLSNLPDTGCKWSEQLAMALMCVSGEDTGTRCTYSTTSRGGIQCINGMLGELSRRLHEVANDSVVAVVELGVDSYVHKRYGKIYKPMLTLLRWASLSDTPSTAPATMPDPEPDPEPAPELAPEPDPKPTRGRRRRRQPG